MSDKASLFKNYCEFTAEAIKTLGGNTAMGTHSIGPYKNRSKCGAPASYWFIYTKDGTLALRMEVAVESGSLKIGYALIRIPRTFVEKILRLSHLIPRRSSWI